MNSFNQTNPIENYNELVENVKETKQKLKKIKKKIGKLIVLMQKYPQIYIITLNIIRYYKKYWGLLISINQNLKKTFEIIPLSGKFYDFYIDIYQTILLKIVEFEIIFQTRDETKIQAYFDSISFDDFDYLFSMFGSEGASNLQKLFADKLELLSGKIRTFEKDAFVEEMKANLKKLQKYVIEQINQLGEVQKKQTAEPSAPPQKPLPPIPNQGGGEATAFQTIFNPEKRQWVRLHTEEGLAVLRKFADQ
jgi:hypothetical protein